MIAVYGVGACPTGMLPVYSVGSEKEAKQLLILTCPTNQKGEYIDKFTAIEQTLDNLELFSTSLDEGHDLMVSTGQCDCEGN